MENETFHSIIFSLGREVIERLLAYLEPLHISAAGLLFLCYIRDHEGCKVSELAHGLRMDKAAVTRGLAPLGELGYVEKQRAKIDTRTFHLFLTSAGRLALRGASEVLLEWEEDFSNTLPAEDYRALLDAVTRARDGMAAGRTKKQAFLL